MMQWRCTVCGYIHTGDEPPDICPVCGASKEYFELITDKATSEEKESKTSTQPISAETSDIEWKCSVCGHVHRGETAPAKCQVCGASQDRFQSQEAETTAAKRPTKDSSSTASSATQPITIQSLGRTIKPVSQLVAKSQLITKLHGHPIAVHIPNGLLPVTLIFTFLAMIFEYDPLAVAAKYNSIFVAISMPVVLITGFIDWFNRFDGHLTSIFKIKIICGLIVTALTLVLALWWSTDPQIYLSEKPSRYLFIFINLADFAAAAVAGFYGGKLVFKE